MSDPREYLQIRSDILVAAGISDVGKERKENEDAFWIDESGLIVLVADGMGGHENGAEASRSAIEIFGELLNLKKIEEEMFDGTAMVGVPTEIAKLFPIIDRAVDKAASMLFERNTELKLKMPMGTTIVGIVLVGDNHVLWFHVGDSRIYRWRESKLERLTKDHSAYQEWLDAGKRGAEPGKNIISRALGTSPIVYADTNWDKRQEDDVFILCSDGLTDMVTDDEIAEILKPEHNVYEVTHSLVEAALEAGGHDNTTVVVCRV